MVKDLFGVEPDAWQRDVLRAFPKKQRIALKASKGVGKTCVLAWLAWNFLLTRPHPKIAATSISADTLSDTLWTEMAMWRSKSPLLTQMFEWTKTRIFCKESPETWWMTARSWSKTADSNQQANTLAGLHADYIMFILDESGGIPDAVMVAAEAALASCVEGHVVQAGNPTHLTGPLYRACQTEDKRYWYVVTINGDPDDPKRATRVDIEWARGQINTYGRDNPWVMINVFGQFPPTSMNTLIGPDEVREATRRQYRLEDYSHSAKVLGVDVAMFGDDSSVLFPRQGLVAFEPKQYRNLTGTQGAEMVARHVDDWSADAVFVDNTGGYGASWIDNMQRLGHTPIGVGFASRPNDLRYYNKRAEMAFDCVQWIQRGGRIPDISELRQALTETTYTFVNDKMLLEPKDQVKARLKFSPDHMDALMLTFASPVSPRGMERTGQRRAANMLQHEYNPFGYAYAGVRSGTTAGKQSWPGMGKWDK